MSLMRTTVVITASVAVLAACSASSSRPGPSGSGTTPEPTPSATSTPSEENPFVGRSSRELGQSLLRAAARGDERRTRQLVEADAPLEVRDARRRTPLLLAVTHDKVRAAKVLVDAGADPDALDDRHDTPWLVTGVTGSVAMAKVLLDADPDLTIRNRFGGISHIPASERGHADYVAFVLENTDIKVDHVNDLGWTALLEAVILGKGTRPWQRIVAALLEAGADPSIADRDGVTPLQHARAKGFTQIADQLRRAT